MITDISSYNTLIPDVLSRFKNETFIETGSNRGLGIKVALDCGFKTIISCDINNDCYNYCVGLYKNNEKVKLYLSDSINFLRKVSETYNNNITFWLDAHDDSTDICPITRELDVIKTCYSNTNTILVDDINLIGRTWAKSITLDIIKQKILEINGNYNIEILDRRCKYGGQLLAAFL